MPKQRFNPLPGFRLTLGFSVVYLSLMVLIPLGALALRASSLTWSEFWKDTTNPRALAAYKLTFGASFIAASINACFGTLLAWVLVRYWFPGKRVIDALVDIPFALPTAVAGLTLSSLFAPNGWLGSFLTPLGIHGAYSKLGVVIALTFVSLPFVVRTLQPVIEGLELEIEEAAATLGASRFRTFTRIVFPTLFPTIVTGFAMAFARAIGEYGSVIFISNNKMGDGEIAPLVIFSYLEQYEYGAAMSVAIILLVASFLLLAVINLLERWASHYQT